VIGAACAFAGPLWNVVLMTYAAVLVPNELLGRVMSAAMTVTWGVLPLASLLAGYLLSTLSAKGAIGVLAALMLAAAVVATAAPAIRDAPPLPSDPAPARRRPAAEADFQ
jgi:MFS family permease